MDTNILLSSKYPFHKMDTNNSGSFSITDLTITTEPTNPANPTAGSPVDTYVGAPFTEALTLVYTFNHGYSYVPSTWFMISINNFSTIIGYEGYLIAGDYTSLASSHSIFEIQVTNTAVNFYVRKKDTMLQALLLPCRTLQAQ